MKTVSEFLAEWKVYGDNKDFVAELLVFQLEAFAEGEGRAREQMERLRDTINSLDREIQRLTADTDKLRRTLQHVYNWKSHFPTKMMAAILPELEKVLLNEFESRSKQMLDRSLKEAGVQQQDWQDAKDSA